MKTEDYQDKVAGFEPPELLALYDAVAAGTTADDDWAAGKALEFLVLQSFNREGFDVTWPFSIFDGQYQLEQLDGVVHDGHTSYIIETKDEAEKVNVEPIAKLRNQLLRRPSGTIGLLFSMSGFTSSAVALAKYLAPQTILLWQGDELQYALKNMTMREALTLKYRHAVEYALPDFNIREHEIS